MLSPAVLAIRPRWSAILLSIIPLTLPWQKQKALRGHELPDLDAAKEVQKVLPEVAKDDLPDGKYRTFVVNVQDEAGQTVRVSRDQTVLRAALPLVVAEGAFND
jgi:hypothetical protein